MKPTKKTHWYDYLWIWAALYFALGFFNILFAWLGMIDVLLPILIAVIGGNKWFCNNLCGRGQLFTLLGKRLGLSRNRPGPRWLASRWFRYGFLAFFLAMFGAIILRTYLVFAGAASLKQAVTFFWTFDAPWGWAHADGLAPDWAAQFAFGLYSLMLTSALIGLILMALYRPRTWCAFCPMGSLTQEICKAKQRGKRSGE